MVEGADLSHLFGHCPDSQPDTSDHLHGWGSLAAGAPNTDQPHAAHDHDDSPGEVDAAQLRTPNNNGSHSTPEVSQPIVLIHVTPSHGTVFLAFDYSSSRRANASNIPQLFSLHLLHLSTITAQPSRQIWLVVSIIRYVVLGGWSGQTTLTRQNSSLGAIEVDGVVIDVFTISSKHSHTQRETGRHLTQPRERLYKSGRCERRTGRKCPASLYYNECA